MRLILILSVAVLCLSGCSDPVGSERSTPESMSFMYADKARKDEPILVSLQHVLIAFKGASKSDETIERSLEEAKTLANEVFEKAKAGENFSALVKEFSDDNGEGFSGTYQIVNYGGDGIKHPANPKMNIWKRNEMSKGFTEVGFGLEVDEVGMAEYAPNDSPFGFHIIKRLK